MPDEGHAAMFLGTRKIRSAGGRNGDIEVTLPAALKSLIKLRCRIVVRDGAEPEIVLQPDLAKARSLIGALWRKLALALGAPEIVDDLDPSAVALTLLPPRQGERGGPLAYADIIRLGRGREEWSEDDTAALGRILSALTASLGQALGLHQTFASAFGEAFAFAVTQAPADDGNGFERSVSAGHFRDARVGPPAPLDDEFWQACAPALRRIYRQFLDWQDHPDRYEAAREQWSRALPDDAPACSGLRPLGEEAGGPQTD
jgi:hypothetical protein